MNDKIKYFALGFSAVFILKYIIVGLDKWNAAFHPNRKEGTDTSKYKKGIIQ